MCKPVKSVGSAGVRQVHQIIPGVVACLLVFLLTFLFSHPSLSPINPNWNDHLSAAAGFDCGSGFAVIYFSLSANRSLSLSLSPAACCCRSARVLTVYCDVRVLGPPSVSLSLTNTNSRCVTWFGEPCLPAAYLLEQVVNVCLTAACIHGRVNIHQTHVLLLSDNKTRRARAATTGKHYQKLQPRLSWSSCSATNGKTSSFTLTWSQLNLSNRQLPAETWGQWASSEPAVPMTSSRGSSETVPQTPMLKIYRGNKHVYRMIQILYSFITSVQGENVFNAHRLHY